VTDLRETDTGPGGMYSRMEEIGYRLHFEETVTCQASRRSGARAVGDHGEHAREHEEQDMRQHWVSRSDFEDMIRNGLVTDDSTLAAYLLFLLHAQTTALPCTSFHTSVKAAPRGARLRTHAAILPPASRSVDSPYVDRRYAYVMRPLQFHSGCPRGSSPRKARQGHRDHPTRGS